MVSRLQCAIEWLNDPSEEAWILSVSHADVPAMILLLNGLLYRKIFKITFEDEKSAKTVSLTVEQNGNYVLYLQKRPLSVTKVWVEAVLSMLLDSHFCGWGEGAHMDAEFYDSQGTVGVTISISFS